MSGEQRSVVERPLEPSSKLGPYEIVGVVGVGAMGTVYEARHAVLGRQVAIKVLRSSVSTADMVDRLIAEGRAASNLGHPHIVECTDLGETPDGLPYLVMEFLEGVTLAAEVETQGMLPISRACNIALQIASALEATHAAGIVHRDLKSENVFLLPRVGGGDHVKVIDFGISRFDLERRLTKPGTLLGTADFMSPEQVTDPTSIDHRTDIYALGVILYQMLAGRLPYEDIAFPMVLSRIVDGNPPSIDDYRPGVPQSVTRVVERCMAHDRTSRYPDAAGFIADLRSALPEDSWLSPAPRIVRAGGRESTPIPRVLTHPSAITSPATLPSAAPPRRRAVLAIAGAGIVAAGVGAWLLWGRGEPDAPAPPPATAAATIVVDVEVPNVERAELVFRGDVHVLPFRTTVPRGAAGGRELFEVRAPGRQPKQLWLASDRDVTLRTELAPLEPVAVATTDALAPTPPTNPVSTPREPATPPDTKARPAVTVKPRPQPTSKPTTEPPPTTGSGSSTVEPPTNPVPPPQPLPPPTKPIKPIEPPDTKPGVKPGSVDPVAVRAAVSSHLGEVRRCFDRGKIEDSEIAGRVVVVINLSPTGTVTNARISATDLHNETTESCLTAAVRSWQFPSPAGGVAAAISYPFVFK